MEINQLMQVLKKGTSYTLSDEDGSQHQELMAPNKYMIKAARVIEGLVERLDVVSKNTITVQNMLKNALDEAEMLRARIQFMNSEKKEIAND